MADGGVWGGDSGRGGGAGAAADAGSVGGFECAADAALYRQTADQARVGGSGVGAGSDFARGRGTDELGRMGRRGGRSGKTWRISARSAQNVCRVRLQRISLRALWTWLRSHPH